MRRFNSTHSLLFAPEPKLASFSLAPGHGVILAEDYFAQTYVRMRAAYLRGDAAATGNENDENENVLVATSKSPSQLRRATSLHSRFTLRDLMRAPNAPLAQLRSPLRQRLRLQGGAAGHACDASSTARVAWAAWTANTDYEL